MNNRTAQRLFFGALLVAVTAAFIWLISGFVQPIFWAVALAIVFFPLHLKLVDACNGRNALAAAISVIVILLIVVLPLGAIITAMATEAATLATRLEDAEVNPANAIDWVTEHLPALEEALLSIGITLDDARSALSSGAINVSRFLASQAVAIGQNTIRITVYFFLMLYLLYFFMRDGTKMIEGLVRALPFGDERERHLLERFAQVSRATIKGSLVVGIAQGAIGGILFAILGIGAPVLWGVVMALLSIVPAVGPALVWLPAAVILFVNGAWIKAIILIVVGSLIIGLVDNLLRPLLVGRDTKMPDYLILLSTLGGLTGFGIAGVVIGPVIAAFFLSVWEMAEEEYAERAPPDDDTG
jgi:predicted PurR-regulated permease PerM